MFTFKLIEEPTMDKEFQVMVKLILSTEEKFEVLSSMNSFI